MLQAPRHLRLDRPGQGAGPAIAWLRAQPAIEQVCTTGLRRHIACRSPALEPAAGARWVGEESGARVSAPPDGDLRPRVAKSHRTIEENAARRRPTVDAEVAESLELVAIAGNGASERRLHRTVAQDLE
jgi:hypothetical protein